MPGWVDRFARIAKNGRAAGRASLEVAMAVGEAIQAWIQSEDDTAQQRGTSDQGRGCAKKEWAEHRQETNLRVAGTANSIVIRNGRIEMVADGPPRKTRQASDDALRLVTLKQVLGEGSSARECAHPLFSTVEYYSSTHGRWILAQVLSFNSDSTYDLNVKPRVHPNQIRKPVEPPLEPPIEPPMERPMEQPMPRAQDPKASAAGEVAASLPGPCQGAYLIGREVEYRSATVDGWVPTKVVSFRPATGHFDLTCKEDVPPSQLRWPSRSIEPTEDPLAAAHGVGSLVEYESTSQHCRWIPAKVLLFDERTGRYDLDCKAQVEPKKVRAMEDFPVGSLVEYGSSAQRAGEGLSWIPATVLRLNADTGLYDLNIREQAERGRIRWPR